MALVHVEETEWNNYCRIVLIIVLPSEPSKTLRGGFGVTLSTVG